MNEKLLKEANKLQEEINELKTLNNNLLKARPLNRKAEIVTHRPLPFGNSKINNLPNNLYEPFLDIINTKIKELEEEFKNLGDDD